MRKYAIKVYDTQMKEIARINDALKTEYEMKLNSLWTCSFTLPKESKKNKYCRPFNYVELFDGNERVELFRILPNTLNKGDVTEINYQCEHVLATLIDDVMFKYHQVGNIGHGTAKTIRYVLDKQTTPNWQLVECDFDRMFEYKWENENLLSALFSIPKPFIEQYRWEFDTTSKPWGLYLKKIKQEYKADIQYKKNMQSMTKTSDPTNIITRLYALGYGEGDNQLTIEPVNNGVPYIERNTGKYGIKSSILVDRRFESPQTLFDYAQSILNEASEPYVSYQVKAVDLHVVDPHKHKKFFPGDMVYIKDSEENKSVVLPIVGVKKGDVTGSPWDVDLEIANKKQDISGTVSDLMERARINDTYAQGATNIQQIAYADNADESHGLKLKFYLPHEMVRINKLLLNFEAEKFRAYSKGASTQEGEVVTSSSGGGEYINETTSAGGGEYVSETTSAGGGVRQGTSTESSRMNTVSQSSGVDEYTMGSWGGHNHGISPGNNLYSYEPSTQSHKYIGQFEQSGNHKHTMDIPLIPHTHDLRIDVPDHVHSLTMRIKEHVHKLTMRIKEHVHTTKIPAHKHDIVYGIYEGEIGKKFAIKVDGVDAVTLDGKADNLNIIPYLKKDDGGKITRGTWHTVEITPDGMTHISANIFIQLFTTSRGGGDF